MMGPTKEQLQNAAWWDENAPEGAVCMIGGEFTRWDGTDELIMNVVSISGGKDSTATALLAIYAYGAENLIFVFADTGNELQETYDYLDYLEEKLCIRILRVKANFDFEINRKREKLINNDLPGWTDAATAETKRLTALVDL